VLAAASGCLVFGLLGGSSAPVFAAGVDDSAVPSAADPELKAKIATLRQQQLTSPQDARLRFQLGKALLAAGDRAGASIEFLEATSLEPSYYIAYHQLTQCKPSNDQLDEASERLIHLRDERPNELMLRVALSEILEQRGDCYAAARALIDLSYQPGGVPAQLLPKVQARIHYLLSQTKDSHTADNAKTNDAGLEPLPAAPTSQSQARRDLAASKAKDSGFGHSTLLP